MQDLNELKQYYASLGMNERAIEKMVSRSGMRTPALIQQKIEKYQTWLQIDTPTAVRLITRFPNMLNYGLDSWEANPVEKRMKDYQDLLHADAKTVAKLITAYPALLSFDSVSDKPTAVKSKIQDFQTYLHADLATVQKMIIAFPMMLGLDTKTTVKNKIADLQTALQADTATVAKIVTAFPQVLGYEITGNSPTAVNHKLQDLKEIFRTDDQTLTSMLAKAPVLLGLDTASNGPTSLRTKMDKMRAVLAPEQLQAAMVKKPALLTMPAQAFKIRYLIAEQFGVTPRFLQVGFMIHQNKVWARASYLNRQPGVFNLNNIYIGEKRFSERFGVATADLMQHYPLDQAAVTNLENHYYIKTGHKLTLDQQERAVLGLEK